MLPALHALIAGEPREWFTQTATVACLSGESNNHRAVGRCRSCISRIELFSGTSCIFDGRFALESSRFALKSSQLAYSEGLDATLHTGAYAFSIRLAMLRRVTPAQTRH
eukprot:6449406-Pyramimonas_sp.AAC.1